MAEPPFLRFLTPKCAREQGMREAGLAPAYFPASDLLQAVFHLPRQTVAKYGRLHLLRHRR